MSVSIHLHDDDIPENLLTAPLVAIDTEAMGLKPWRDRLCLVQLTAGDGDIHLLHFKNRQFDRVPVLKTLLTSETITKIFHFGRFDMALLSHALNITVRRVVCTKIASRLVRTYTDRHGLKDLCKELLNIEISKQEQMSDWGTDNLSQDQLRYAAGDVAYLHQLWEKLQVMLHREDRWDIAQACFDFLPYRATLDIMGGEDLDIFQH